MLIYRLYFLYFLFSPLKSLFFVFYELHGIDVIVEADGLHAGVSGNHLLIKVA